MPLSKMRCSSPALTASAGLPGGGQAVSLGRAAIRQSRATDERALLEERARADEAERLGGKPTAAC
jgi:hypothetical protein